MEYTPGSDVAAGDVVVIDEIVGIAHRDIDADTLGTLYINGGVYKVKGDAAITQGSRVYWVDSSNKCSESAGSGGANKAFGVAVTACDGDGEYFEVAHIGAA